jgi:hypothetical protein
MKKLHSLSLLIICISIFTACNYGSKQQTIAKVPHYPSLEAIVQSSSVIVEVEMLNTFETKHHSGTDFTMTKAKVIDVITAEKNTIENEITIITMPEYQEKERYLLFLDPYEGPITNDPNTYSVKGLYQGKLLIDSTDKITSPLGKNSDNPSFLDEVLGESVAEVKQRIIEVKK